MNNTTISQAKTDFLKNLSDKTKEEKANYELAFEVLETLAYEYPAEVEATEKEADERIVPISAFKPKAIAYMLEYFIIRKFPNDVEFRINTAKITRGFFSYLAENEKYSKEDAATIEKIASRLEGEYQRVENLSESLWNYTEADMNELMKMSPEESKKKIAELQAKGKDSTIKDVGYVTITEARDGLVYGIEMTDNNEVGPIVFDDKSLELVRPGDIVNMITIGKSKDSSTWEIMELGNVYPSQHFSL